MNGAKLLMGAGMLAFLAVGSVAVDLFGLDVPEKSYAPPKDRARTITPINEVRTTLTPLVACTSIELLTEYQDAMDTTATVLRLYDDGSCTDVPRDTAVLVIEDAYSLYTRGWYVIELDGKRLWTEHGFFRE